MRPLLGHLTKIQTIGVTCEVAENLQEFRNRREYLQVRGDQQGVDRLRRRREQEEVE